jgi:hypothetical protein
MANRLDHRKIRNNTDFWVDKSLENELDCDYMIGAFVLDLIIGPVSDLMGDKRATDSDTFYDSVCEHILLLPIIDLIFD